MNYFQGHPNRFYQPWAYFPIQPHIYPNYPPVDPNQPWIPVPYGNPPLLNGRQSETDGDQETNVDDERSNGGSFPPPGVGLPAASTMHQQQVYQVMPPFSNMYVSGIPSNVPGFVNSPMPYPHTYSAGIAAGSETNSHSPTTSRSGRGSGKSTSGTKISGGEKSGMNANDSSLNSQQLLTSPEPNSTNDPSTPTLTSTLGPSHPPTNFMPMGPVQYGFPPYFSTPGPPPPHMSSAQHAAGSHLYISHHSLPVYHAGPIYNSAPAAVFSTDNGMPHSAMSTAPVSMQPQNDVNTNQESESNSFASKENSLGDTYKNSNSATDSACFEEEDSQKHGGDFAQEDPADSNEIISENVSLPNNNDHSIRDGVQCSSKEGEAVVHDLQRADDNSVSSGEKMSPTEQPVVSTEKTAKSDSSLENDASAVYSVKDECTKVYDKEPESEFTSKNALNNIVYKNGIIVGTSTGDVSAPVTTLENGIDCNGKANETDTKILNSLDSLNGKNSGSPNAIPGHKATTESKKENFEEIAPPPSMKTWASLFHSSSSKSKSSSSTLTKTSEISNNNSTSTYQNQNSESHSSTTSAPAMSFNNGYSMNGVHPAHSSQNKAPMYSRHSSASSSSLADDTTLPKIGSLLKSYRLDHKAVNFEPRGLENRSNFCYVNAILQALLACPPFYNLMKCISTNLHNPKTKAASRQYFPIIESMAQFVEEFKPISQKARMREKAARKMDTFQELIPGKPFEPSSMLSVIQGNSLFTVGQQEDAQEFLTCLLNGLNDEMVELIQLADGNNTGVNSRKSVQVSVKAPPPKNNVMSNGDINSEVNAPDDSDSEWKQVSSRAKSSRPNNLALTRTPLSEIFRGQTRSRLQKIGDQTTNNIEPFFTLHLNIEKVSSVRDALEALFGQSPLEGVTSSRTNQEVDAWQQQTLEELPYVLLLHLKYFDFKQHTCTKILKTTEFPIDLKVEPKLISGRTKMPSLKSRQYKLFAVVYHDGKEATKGHYVTDVFHIGYGGWIRYDDAKVFNVSESDVLKPLLPRVPYLLYYRRCDTIAALMQPPFEKRM